MNIVVSSVQDRSRCSHAPNRVAACDEGPTNDRGDTLEGMAYGAGGQPRARALGVGATGPGGADHASAGRGTYDDLAHAGSVPGGRPGPCGGGRAATRQAAPIPHRGGSADYRAGMLGGAGRSQALDTAAVGAGGRGATRDEADQPRDDSSASKKNCLKTWRRLMWCIGALTEQYRQRMYELLALYARPHCDSEPVVCLDETSAQLLADSRVASPIPPRHPLFHHSA